MNWVISFDSCNFSLIKSSNTGHLFWLYNTESEFVSKYNQVVIFLAISIILHSISVSSLLQREVWLTLVRKSCNTRSAQMRTRLTLTQLAPFTCHFFLCSTPRKPSKVTKNSNLEARSQKTSVTYFLHESSWSCKSCSIKRKHRLTQPWFKLLQF